MDRDGHARYANTMLDYLFPVLLYSYCIVAQMALALVVILLSAYMNTFQTGYGIFIIATNYQNTLTYIYIYIYLKIMSGV